MKGVDATNSPPTDSQNISLFGRNQEMITLLSSLSENGPKVTIIQGITGIGKSALLHNFQQLATEQGAKSVTLDCRFIEPTPLGFQVALTGGADLTINKLDEILYSLSQLAPIVLLCIDHYEKLLLMDSWLRQTLLPQLAENIRIVLATRRPPVSQWFVSPALNGQVRMIPLTSLDQTSAKKLLLNADVPEDQHEYIIKRTHGNPLALKMAAVSRHTNSSVSQGTALQQVMQELTEIFLSEVTSSGTREAIERASVARRITKSLLRALPDVDESEFEQIKKLPFVDHWPDGLHLHDAVHEAVSSTFRASDPEKYFSTRHFAWQQICEENKIIPKSALWRTTADMLFLIENPVIREAFFPSTDQEYAVEPALAADWPTIKQMIIRHEKPDGLEPLSSWWENNPESFKVVRSPEGKVVAFYCMAELSDLSNNVIDKDPLLKSWLDHIKSNPIATAERVLFLRRWLAMDEGEAPSSGQAACWLDVKRAYMELRPQLRRVYLTLIDLVPYAPVAVQLGFKHLTELATQLGDNQYQTALLDFGPKSVDGWVSRLVGEEIESSTESVLDHKRQSLTIEGTEVSLTPLEYNLALYLQNNTDSTVSRNTLLEHVWGYRNGEGTSNVVDAVVKTLRRKLGPISEKLETVRGFGYRWSK